LSCAGCAEEVCLRTGCQHQEVSLVALAIGRSDRPSLGVSRDNLRHLHFYIAVSQKKSTKRRGNVVGAQHGDSQLIEKGLQLVIVVLIDERDTDGIALSDLARAGETGKAPAYDHDVLC